MLRNKYGKDQLYLRLIQKEKNDYLAKQSNNLIKKISNDSKEAIKYSRKKINQTHIVSPSISPKVLKNNQNFFHELQTSSSKDQKILQPIISRAREYEKAIKTYLGDEILALDSQRLLKKVPQTHKIETENRAKSSIGFKQKEIFDTFDHELKAIEARELSLKKNIRNLSIKQKHMKDVNKFSKSPLAIRSNSKENSKINLTQRFGKESSARVYESLERVNKLLTNFLKSPTIKTHFNANQISKLSVNK